MTTDTIVNKNDKLTVEQVRNMDLESLYKVIERAIEVKLDLGSKLDLAIKHGMKEQGVVSFEGPDMISARRVVTAIDYNYLTNLYNSKIE